MPIQKKVVTLQDNCFYKRQDNKKEQNKKDAGYTQHCYHRTRGPR